MADERADENFREKRKWQIALRRYVVEKQKTVDYAPYFGIDIMNFRKWIELQFDQGLKWENFGKSWQLDHIIPLAYFDFKSQPDLKLCWNFINIRVEKSHSTSIKGSRVDVLTAKTFFNDLFNNTRFGICLEMIRKIELIELSHSGVKNKLESFVQQHYDYLSSIESFSGYEFEQLNLGVGIEDILLEKAMLMKFNK